MRMNSLISAARMSGRKLTPSVTMKRGFCYPTTIEVTPEIRRRNAATAVTLLVSVGVVYYVAMAAMKEEADEITAAMQPESETTELK